MTFKKRIEDIRSNPGAYFRSNRKKTPLREDTPIEDLLCLFITGTALYDATFFEDMSELIVEHGSFRDNREYQYYYHLTRGLFFRFIGEMHHSLESARNAYKLAVIIEDPDYICRTLTVLGSVSGASREYEAAFYYFEEALDQIDRITDSQLQADVFSSFGVLLFKIGERSRAKNAYYKALDHYNKIDSRETILNYTILLLNLAEIHDSLNEYDKALEYLMKGAELAEKGGFSEYIGSLMPLISDMYYKKKDYEKAYGYIRRYVRQNNLHRDKLNTVNRHYDADRLKEEIFSLSLLNKRNEDLNNRLISLYSRIDSLDENGKREETLLEQISEAISTGRMVCYYQPKWSRKENRVTGAEALVRWVKEDGTVVFPGDFIELLENTPLMHGLTCSVIRQAFRFCAYIRDNFDPHFCVSVNVSPYELKNHDVVSYVEKEMLLNGLYPGNVEIEIIERTFLDQNPSSMNQLFTLKELGIRIALDDFGTGYSSLSYLNRIPFDRVKVDRSLLLNASTVNKGDKMLRSIITLLHELDFPVTVEGVEKMTHLQLLDDFGCDEMQGFYFGKAVPSEEFTDFFRK